MTLSSSSKDPLQMSSSVTTMPHCLKHSSSQVSVLLQRIP